MKVYTLFSSTVLQKAIFIDIQLALGILATMNKQIKTDMAVTLLDHMIM